MIVRISERLWDQVKSMLLARSDVETAVVLHASVTSTLGGGVLAVRRVLPVPDDAYLTRRIDRISIDPLALNRLVRGARDAGMSVLTVHSHPMAEEAWFSHADDVGDSRLMPSLKIQIPGVPHGSIVMAGSGKTVCRVFEGTRPTEAQLHVVGRRVERIVENRPEEHWFGRQTLALGEDGTRLVRAMRVGIVGLGGIGSVVNSLICHHGVQQVVCVDGDVVEDTNVPRIVGASVHDVGLPKVDVAARYSKRLGFPVTHCLAHRYIRAQGDLELLRNCDVVFSCVDRHAPRALLNRLSYESLVPVIDMGAGFRVAPNGEMIGDAGRVVVIGPGRECLACWGHLNPAALRVESLGQEERDAEVAEGYLAGAAEPEPSVMAFNSAVASMGVVEFLRLATGFAGASSPPARLAFQFSMGTVRRNRLAQRSEVCCICGSGPHTRDAVA